MPINRMLYVHLDIYGYMLKYSLVRWLPFDLEVKLNSPKWVRSSKVPRCSKVVGCSYRILIQSNEREKHDAGKTVYKSSSKLQSVKTQNAFKSLNEPSWHHVIFAVARPWHQSIWIVTRASQISNSQLRVDPDSRHLPTLFFHDLFLHA